MVGKPHEGKTKSRLRHARVFISNMIFNINKRNEGKKMDSSLKIVSQNESPDRDDKNRTRGEERAPKGKNVGYRKENKEKKTARLN